MTTTPKDGGPAFPCVDHMGDGHWGMSLRDWFTGQALAGMMTAKQPRFNEVAEFAYMVADAMIKEREASE